MITRRAVLIFGSAAALITFIRMPAQTFKPAKEPHMDIDIKRIGSRPSQKGPEDWFTGTVRIDPLFQSPEPARTGAAQVTFEPGARTAWRTHRVAHAPARADSDRDSGAGVGTARRRSDRGDPSGRRRVVSARTETLAWRVADECHDPHRHPGVGRWQGRRLDGEGQRRAIPEAMSGPLPGNAPSIE